MNQLQLLEEKKADILQVAGKYGARNLRIFGSAARGEQTADSDVDFLVELEPGRSLLDQIGFQQELEGLLGVSVDVVVDGGISPHLEEQILAEAVPL